VYGGLLRIQRHDHAAVPQAQIRVNQGRRRLQSHRSAIIGSTFVARRAGSQQATRATANNSAAINAKISGSVALTPYSKLFIKRVAA
jgi:hypothetical protein